MQLVEPVHASWKARLALEFEGRDGKTVLARREHDGPLVVQKPLYPEGEAVCHAIVVHPPGGIAGGDELLLDVSAHENAKALLTTPGAAKWYRSAGPLAQQKIELRVDGDLEWLPQETIVFDGALADMDCAVSLGAAARYIGWEILCLGRTGSGETFGRGSISMRTTILRNEKPIWWESGRIDGGGRLTRSPAGLAGKPVCGTLLAAAPGLDAKAVAACREVGEVAVTLLPGVLAARYLGDSSEAAKRAFVRLWRVLRPIVFGREAIEPRIWRT